MKLALLALTLAAAGLAGCTAAATRDVNANQRLAVNRVAASYGEDLALQRSFFDVIAASDRKLAVAQVQNEFLLNGYVSPGGKANAEKFLSDVADPKVQTALVLEVRDGSRSREDAVAWLSDYAVLQGVPSAKQLREQMVASLRPIRMLDAAVAEAGAALDARAKGVTSLLGEVDANQAALEAFANRQTLSADAVRGGAVDLFRISVLARVTDPAKRAALERLLAGLDAAASGSPAPR